MNVIRKSPSAMRCFARTGMWAKTIVASARELMIMAMLIGASCRLFAGSDISRPFVFGMNTGSTQKECELAKSAGCTCMRIGCGWDLVEKTHGAYDFSEPDAAVAQCVKCGFEPFFLVVATPPFYLKEHMRDKVWGRPVLPEYYPQAERF